MISRIPYDLARTIVPPIHRLRIRRAFCFVRSFFYKGNGVECPCCGYRFKRFLPDRYGPGPNPICPRCESAARHRLVYLFLKDKTTFFSKDAKILHFAPEYSLQNAFGKMSNLHYFSADLGSPLATARVDIQNMPYESDSFDVIVCIHVLEHVADDRKAMSELLRVLKPGGFALLQSPIDRERETTFEDPDVVLPEDRERVFGQADHLRVYGRDYGLRLEQIGFEVNVDNYAWEMDKVKVELYGIVPEDIYYCVKPTANSDQQTGSYPKSVSNHR